MKCPSCKATVDKDGSKLYPFCSERCHLIDLGRWLGEEYRIPDQPDTRGGGVESVPRSDEER